jgi:tRNA-specific 2-thiouridylase
MNSNKSKTVYVGLSGGVDSAVSAALLKDAGYKVIAAFIKTWAPDGYPCPTEIDKRESMRVAAHLGIPWIEIDGEESYKNNVANYMLNEYKAGRTPNGDVFCNTTVKFGTFYELAMARGADFIATGHYAQMINGQMHKGIDSSKDQTYFLWNVPKEKLAKTIFPIGNIPKTKVRELAKKYKLPNAERPDSQGVCFLGPIDMKMYLKEMLDPKPGNILDTDGNVIGTHDGAILYTVGERHGFTITKSHTNPYFVISKDVNNNTLTVSTNKDQNKNINDIYVSEINPLVDEPLTERELSAVFRYHGEEYKIKLDKNNKIYFLGEKPSVAEGQSVVFYDGNKCLGGGIINYSI